MRMCRGYPEAVQPRVQEDLQIVQEGVHEEEEVQDGVQEAEEGVQERVQEQLQLVLFCTSATTITDMKSRSGGGRGGQPVVLVRVTETESMATVYLRPDSPLFVRGGHTYTRSTGQCA